MAKKKNWNKTMKQFGQTQKKAASQTKKKKIDITGPDYSGVFTKAQLKEMFDNILSSIPHK